MRYKQMFVGAIAALAFAIGGALGQDAYAQSTAAQDRDAAELKKYRLTMEKIRQLAKAGEAVQKALEADPRYKAQLALAREIEVLEKKEERTEAEEERLEQLLAKKEAEEAKADDDDSPNAQTLDEMARQIEREPAIAGAIKSAGMTPREYALVSLSLFEAVLARGLQASSGGKELEGSLPANIKLVADNEEEITRLMEKLKALRTMH